MVEPAQAGDVLELDEAWSFVGRRSNKRWLWTAMCRRTRQIVAFAIGDHSARTCARLWSKIPDGYRACQSFSDFWKAYRQVFSAETHQQVGKAAGEVSLMERFYSCAPPAFGTVRSEDALTFEVRPDASLGHEVVHHLLQHRAIT